MSSTPLNKRPTLNTLASAHSPRQIRRSISFQLIRVGPFVWNPAPPPLPVKATAY